MYFLQGDFVQRFGAYLQLRSKASRFAASARNEQGVTSILPLVVVTSKIDLPHFLWDSRTEIAAWQTASI
jgi:hypothetical protein